MSFDSDDISNVLNVGLTGALAFGALGMMSKAMDSAIKPSKKKMKHKKSNEPFDFSFGEFY